jgi:outer membrane biosynthesis protein TonB
MVDVAPAREDNQITVSEIWSYHSLGDQVRFNLVHRSREVAPVRSAPKAPKAPNAPNAPKVPTPTKASGAKKPAVKPKSAPKTKPAKAKSKPKLKPKPKKKK